MFLVLGFLAVGCLPAYSEDGLRAALETGSYRQILRDPEAVGTSEWAWARFFLVADRKAFEVARKRHGEGDTLGSFVLLKCLREGVGVKRDESEEAKINFRIRSALEAIESPSALEHYLLAQLEPGDEDGVVRSATADDSLEAKVANQEARWNHLIKSAEAGFAQAMDEVGFALQRDDEAGAFEWYRKAAESGLASGMKNLGYLYALSEIRKDPDKAREWTFKGARAGDIYAMVNVGAFKDREVLDNITLEEAQFWIDRAAESGHDLGKLEKGLALLIGNYGYRKDPVSGFRLLQSAAASGHSFALGQIAFFYLEGVGVEKDWGKAAEFAEAAWVQGNRSSARMLAHIYGEGSPERSDAKSKYWKTQAMGGGLAYAAGLDETHPEIVKALAEIDPFSLKVE